MKKKLSLLTILILATMMLFVCCSNIDEDVAINHVDNEETYAEEIDDTKETEIKVTLNIEVENETNETNETEEKETETFKESKEVKEESKEVKKEVELGINNESSNLISLGEFKLTAYCKCEVCCGKWPSYPTASGVMPTENHTIAVDTNIIPFGTEILIDGNVYVAEDTGSAIKGNRIDIYMPDHKSALEFGVRHREVFKMK